VSREIGVKGWTADGWTAGQHNASSAYWSRRHKNFVSVSLPS